MNIKQKISKMKTIWISFFILFIIVLTGCATTKKLNSGITGCLDSCVGKLTTTDVLMFATSPSEKNIISDGEIWIYKYRKSTSTYTTTGTGGLLLPYQTTEKTYDYAYDVILRFNEKGILVEWRTNGNLVWDRDVGISAQDIPFYGHWCY